MNNEKARITKEYLSSVIRALNCSRSMASVFRKKFADEIDQFSEEHENLTYEMLCERFGTPEEIADGFIDRTDYEQLLKSAKRKATFWRWSAVALSLVVILCIVSMTIFIIELGNKTTISDVVVDSCINIIKF